MATTELESAVTLAIVWRRLPDAIAVKHAGRRLFGRLGRAWHSAGAVEKQWAALPFTNDTLIQSLFIQLRQYGITLRVYEMKAATT